MRKAVKPKPLETNTAEIESFSHDGRGIARIDGKITFIDAALPNEKVSFQYTKRKKDFDEGKMIALLSPPSSLRAEPQCAHYLNCGGCSLQHLNAEAQISVKQNLLMDTLLRIGHVKPEKILAPLRATSWHYRSKARLSVRYVAKKNGVLLGFREKHNPRYVAEISQCPILRSELDKEIIALRALIGSFDNPHAIAQIELAAGDEDIALIFRNLEPLSKNDEEKLKEFGERTAFSLFLQPGGLDSIYLFFSRTNNGFLHYTLKDEGLKFVFHPADFTQINLPLNQKMVTRAIELMELQENDRVLDLFCGLGNFSLALAKHCKKVFGVEGSAAMVARASVNAGLNNISNANFYALNLDTPAIMDEIAQIAKKEGEITKVLLDPPRTGALECVKQIQKLDPKRIVYVSCNPATLARDSDILVHQHGYHMIAAGVMDMFPHTAHVESIAVFVKER